MTTTTRVFEAYRWDGDDDNDDGNDARNVKTMTFGARYQDGDDDDDSRNVSTGR